MELGGSPEIRGPEGRWWLWELSRWVGLAGQQARAVVVAPAGGVECGAGVAVYCSNGGRRVSVDALSSACLAKRCSSSWGLVAPHHRWPLAPQEQMGIRHMKGAWGSGDGRGWAAIVEARTLARVGRLKAVSGKCWCRWCVWAQAMGLWWRLGNEWGGGEMDWWWPPRVKAGRRRSGGRPGCVGRCGHRCRGCGMGRTDQRQGMGNSRVQ
jgi:hypothetical protein